MQIRRSVPASRSERQAVYMSFTVSFFEKAPYLFIFISS